MSTPLLSDSSDPVAPRGERHVNGTHQYSDSAGGEEDHEHRYHQLSDTPDGKHIELAPLLPVDTTSSGRQLHAGTSDTLAKVSTSTSTGTGTKPPTPLPKMQLGLLGTCLYGVLFSQNVLFPFLPFMVQSFFPHYARSKLGFRAGWLGSAFPAGTIFSSYVWGKLADRYGRKICLLFGLMTTAVTIGAFGMSPTFEAAVILRLMSGALNGNNGIVKAMVAEVCDSSNMARGMSLIGLLGGLARLTAPALGGYLAEPATQYDALSGFQFLRDWPYALPCFVGTLIATVSMVLVALYLKETLKAPSAGSKQSAQSDVGIWALLKGPTGVPILLNAILGLLAITQTEIIPLWLVVSRELGGFDSSAAFIATLLMALGPFQMMHQIYVYPRLAKRFQYKQLLLYALSLMGVTSVLLPYAFYLSYVDKMLAWVGLFTVFIVMVLARVTCFTCVFVVLNNSSTTATRARANGLAQSCASIAQLVGPLCGAILFALTVNFAVWPLDFSFVWSLMALFCAWAAWLTARLPDTINDRRSDDDDSDTVKAPDREQELNINVSVAVNPVTEDDEKRR